MHIAAVVMVVLSIAAGIVETRDSDPAGRGYALVIPIVFGHIAALIPAFIASRSSSRAAIARRAPLWYVLASGLGLLTAAAIYPLVPNKGPPPEPPAPTIERVAAALAGMVNAQGAFARITMTGESGRVVRVHGMVNDLREYEDLKRRTMSRRTEPTRATSNHFVDYYGYTPEQALQCATRNGGLMFWSDGSLRTLQQGSHADLLLVNGNPLKDLNLLVNAEI